MIKRYFCDIDESAAKAANDANNMADYKDGNATAIYRARVEEIYKIVDEIEEKRPTLLDKAKSMACRYSSNLARYYNAFYYNEASCPSLLVCGGGNFPVKKKNRQNARRDSLLQEWNNLESYKQKIKSLVTSTNRVISSDDDYALELMEEKVSYLMEQHELMKKANRAIRKKDTEAGDDELKALGFSEAQVVRLREMKGYDSYEISSMNTKIKRYEKRIEELTATIEGGDKEYETEYCYVTEDAQAMRLQLCFDYGYPAPDAEQREILKANGFKWSPKNKVWQKLLNDNARAAVERVVKAFKEIEEKENA